MFELILIGIGVFVGYVVMNATRRKALLDAWKADDKNNNNNNQVENK